MNCTWCGRECGNAAACERCAPNQSSSAHVPERDEEFQPGPTYVAGIVQLRALLGVYGVQPIDLPPDDPEFCEINEARWAATL